MDILCGAGRWSGHISDINAAGSFFAMGTFIALGIAIRDGRHRFAWIAMAAVPLVGDDW